MKGPTLNEVIVVEGRNDTHAVRRAVQAETIETGGSALSADVLSQIQLAQKRRGIIILTDPDVVGERIRREIAEAVPGCKHAFIPRHEAVKNGDVGIEHARPDAIRQAIAQAVDAQWQLADQSESHGRSQVSWETYVSWGLAGCSAAKERRIRLGEKLGIGYGNAQQMYKKLNRFQITLEEFERAMCELQEETGGVVNEASDRHS